MLLIRLEWGVNIDFHANIKHYCITFPLQPSFSLHELVSGALAWLPLGCDVTSQLVLSQQFTENIQEIESLC